MITALPEGGDGNGAREVATCPPRGGVHVAEWLAEGAGTAVFMIGALSAVLFDLGPDSPMAVPLPSFGDRLLLTGLLVGAIAGLVALSPLGRRSGAHLNPAVSLAYWLTRTMHLHDLAGYVAAQLIGAVAGAIVVQAAWGGTADLLHDGITIPGPGIPDVAALLGEAAMTAVLILAILFLTASRWTRKWTPVAVCLLVGLFVWQLAPLTGASLNPARSFGPAIVSAHLAKLWIYILGPLTGGVAAAGIAWAAGPRLLPVTGKLFHDPNYSTTFRTDLELHPEPPEAHRRGGRGRGRPR